LKPTPAEDAALRRELMDLSAAWRIPPPEVSYKPDPLPPAKIRVDRAALASESKRFKMCALCYHQHHLGKCKHCKCPDNPKT
jgi:hypothetical protein